MKAITEFSKYTLASGVETKTALAAEGKTPEEIQASLGAKFKYEGDKLKYFLNALDVSVQNTGLTRVVIMKLNEGEKAPEKALLIEDLHYISEFPIVYQPPQPSRDGKGGKNRGRHGQGQGHGGGGRSGGGLKESPWGLSPEQKAAKKGAGKAVKA